MAFHDIRIQEVFTKLNSNENGLSDKEVQKRLEKYGKNEIVRTKKISPLKIFIDQFKSFLVIILILAAIISYILSFFGEGSKFDSLLIIAIVVANAFFGFIQDFKAERSIEALKRMSTKYALVLRNGRKARVDSKELVPGDIIFVEEGVIIPADCRIIESKDLKVDESILTGESTAVSKFPSVVKTNTVSEMTNLLFMNTSVVRGKGKAIIIATGMRTEVGKIAQEIQESEEKETQFQKEADDIGKKIGNIILLISGLIFVIHSVLGYGIFEMFIIAISLAVAAVPEGLPIVVTLALSLGSLKMAKQNALVRRLSVIESVGSLEVVCTDKTGTLTENKMTVTDIYFNNRIYKVTGTGLETKGKFICHGKEENPENLKEILLCGALCNNAVKQGKEFFGDPTEVALLVSAEKAGIEKEIYEQEYRRVDEEPFNSVTKRMVTFHLKNSKKLSFMKGAPEVVLKSCTKYKNGKSEAKLTEEKIKEILKVNTYLASKALRVLGFAYSEDGKIENMTFLGLQGMIDPPRKNVKEAIEDCKKAGIKIVMITGDNINTAKAIAGQVGIEGKAISGEQLDRISNLGEIVKKYSIFARVSPHHKLAILKELQKHYIVGMTGDGVNDAPALKNADVGIAMGIRGSDVSRESSDIILLDDNFITIKNAIEEGRRIFENIQKFINYLLTANTGEVIVVFFGSLFASLLFGVKAVPLLASHLLWINLLTDGLPALALAVDPKSKDIMLRNPKNYKRIFDSRIFISIFFVGIMISVSVLPIFYLNLGNKELSMTLVLTSLVMMELVRLQVVRSRYKLGILTNKYLLMAVAFSILLQLIVLYSPANALFNVTPLALNHWLWIFSSLALFSVLSFFFTKIESKI